MSDFIRSRIASFGHAFHGWWFVIRTQKNAWVHAFVSTCVILMALWLGISARDWALIIIVMAMVWSAEFFNTAIEAVVDLASPVQHPLAKAGKDVGAAAVLIAAGASVIVGLIVLGPPLWERIWPYLSR